jgi:hypothetical protein
MKLNYGGMSCCSVCLLYIVIGIVLAIVAGLIIGSVCGFGCKDTTIVCEGGGLCVAQSIHDSVQALSGVRIEIPPFSAITKIVFTIVQQDNIPVNAGLIEVFDPLTNFMFFETYLPYDPQEQFVTHQLDFVHPFCVGENGGSVFLAPLGSGLEQIVARELILNVQFCPGECAGDNGDGCQ